MSDELAPRIGEAVAWCEARAQSAGADDCRLPPEQFDCLRSPDLAPREAVFGKSTLDGLSEASLSARILAIVDDVVGRRRKGLSGAATVVVPAALLRFEVNHCYFDRAAFNETAGFFDAEDLPPWDTWIAYEVATDSLVSWVPESLRAFVQRGVDVHLVDAYSWLTQEDTERLRDSLRHSA